MIVLMTIACVLLMIACWITDVETNDEWREKERELERKALENADKKSA